jgi:hypothetical protein
MSDMKLVYVAGPYTAANAWLVEQNIRRAENMAARVWGEGAAAICPHANARHMLEGVTTPEHASGFPSSAATAAACRSSARGSTTEIAAARSVASAHDGPRWHRGRTGGML